MRGAHQRSSLFLLFRAAGPGVFLQEVRDLIWRTVTYLELRCDLASLPPIRRARFEVKMMPSDNASFAGFSEEFVRVNKIDALNVFKRASMCDAGIQTLYFAAGPDGSPAYVQWLITPNNQLLLHLHQPGRYLTLTPGEALLEGAYTFCQFRGSGAMGDGMAQLLRFAKEEGAHAVYTYVAEDNIPSLRGCANVGFKLFRVRENKRRLGHFSSLLRVPNVRDLETWLAAISPRSST